MNEDRKENSSPNVSPNIPQPQNIGSSNPMQDTINDVLRTQVSAGSPPKAQPLDPNLVQKQLRTYESDLADALSKKGGSVAAISIAEARRKEAESRQKENAEQKPRVPNPDFFPHTPPVFSPQGGQVPIPPQARKTEAVPEMVQVVPHRSLVKPVLFSILSLLFIIGGVAAGYLAFQRSPIAQPEITPQASMFAVSGIIPADKRAVAVAGNAEGNDLITTIYAEINKNPAGEGKNVEIVIAADQGADKTVRYMSGSAFMQKINVRMPDIIFRSLTDRWMFGVYTETTGERTSYLALTTDFFQNAFAGMLMWEDTMPDDLALLLNFKERARRDELTSTSTLSAYFSIRGDWSDKVIRNRDVRIFKTPQGELLFLYSFINKETLVITTTESAFIALIDRIEKEAYVR